MSRKQSSPAGSLAIALLIHSGFIALVIALMIPVLLNQADGATVRKVALKTAPKLHTLHDGVVSARMIKM